MKRKVTMSDIARELNLSRATVSYVLTSRYTGVFIGRDTRNRVLEAAKRMGYCARNPRVTRPKFQRIALLCRRQPASDPVFAGMVLSLVDILNKEGCKVLVRTGREQSEECRIVQDLYNRSEIDAAVFIGCRDQAGLIAMPDVPVIVMGEVPEGMPVWRVTVDNYAAARKVGEYLWSLGHRRVGVILRESQGYRAFAERLAGFKSVWEEHGDTYPEHWIMSMSELPEDDREADGYASALSSFLACAEQHGGALTGLFCCNDWLAGLALRALQQIGIRVPEEMSLVGFDDTQYAVALEPPLTTVHQPFHELGVFAAELLLEADDGPYDVPRVYSLDGELVVRDSSGPAPA